MIRPPALLLPFALAACAQDTTRYPSLAPRAVETRPDVEPDADATPAPVAADASLDASLATANTAIDGNTAAFATAAVKADAAAKVRGARIEGSDAWLTAQGALADLEALHGDLLALTSELDRQATDRAQAGNPPYPGIETAQAKAQAEANAQAARIAAVKGSLGEK